MPKEIDVTHEMQIATTTTKIVNYKRIISIRAIRLYIWNVKQTVKYTSWRDTFGWLWLYTICSKNSAYYLNLKWNNILLRFFFFFGCAVGIVYALASYPHLACPLLLTAKRLLRFIFTNRISIWMKKFVEMLGINKRSIIFYSFSIVATTYTVRILIEWKNLYVSFNKNLFE